MFKTKKFINLCVGITRYNISGSKNGTIIYSANNFVLKQIKKFEKAYEPGGSDTRPTLLFIKIVGL